ncbi:MAG: hypothetical protein M1827_007329 [Pycnora praestabilis]|nr:MAG: hypothetical protein M1827_007329 [Pycnora praestabilis]
MTAVATPLSFQPTPRSVWNIGIGSQGGFDSMSDGEKSRMSMPRKSAQRTNSSSTIESSSSTSSTSTVLPPTSQLQSTDSNWLPKKKPARGLWPSSKTEPVSGISTARPHSIAASSSSGPSAASAMSAIHQPSPILPSQHMLQPQPQQNGARGATGQGQGESPAILHLLPMNGTFERKTITVPFFPEVLRIGRQTNAKTVPTPVNGYFDSKVLSRQHAEIWSDRSGKIWIRDVKSSNGTFVNGQRLSAENRDSEPHELREQDILELGIDIVSEDQKTVVHHKVSARVEHAGIYSNSTNVLDLNFGDIDPAAGGGLMAPSIGQNMSIVRGRAGSQGSVGNGSRLGSGAPSLAGSNMSAMGQQRHMNFWLTPITVEQIVKKLATELKQAKQQSQDLERTTDFFDGLLTQNSPKDVGRSPQKDQIRSHQVNGNAIPPKPDQKARFSEPPAPPPQQPLPEKPDAARAAPSEPAPPQFLRRSDTERPKSSTSVNSSPTKAEPHPQIITLVEALASAKKEIDSQGSRVKLLEDMLQQERSARESAEERAQRLEMESKGLRDGVLDKAGDGTVVKDTLDLHAEANEPRSDFVSDESVAKDRHEDAVPKANRTEQEISEDTAAVNASTARLQQRLELMVVEMDEMKQHMEKYKRRAEKAEQEQAFDRKSLAAMVEKIRRDSADRESIKQGRRTSAENAPQAESGSDTEKESRSVPSESSLVKPNGLNGKPVGHSDVADLEEVVSTALAKARSPRDHFAQSAPYASMLGVVLIGVGLMTYLNGLQKVER